MESAKQRLRNCSVATIVAVLFKKGLATRFMSGLKPLTGAEGRIVGEAFTVRTIPVREDMRAAVARGETPNLHRKALAEVADGQCVVFDGGGIADASPLGDIIALSLKMRGIAAFITDSGVNDLAGIAAAGLPVYGLGPAGVPGSSRFQVVDWNVPVGCAGVAVYPGDIIVADEMGAVCIPRDLAETVAEEAGEQERLEAFLVERIAAGAPLETTYPPDAETRRAYAEWCKTRQP
ncbi:ribonuclease activity regulator RraA [Rhizobiaceae bacterium BDR2-2]|uniref:Ribonuclease activity regulator RraA n=1 Tax=Ectorhizobium quercum TaxID=2965071 RepID=A0AAE3SV76_9HYPH|nr:ribonuclease activity regulator RraA [Ectorhizobium quercum]MCX8997433.1 ribonuclease activity regulator RraA [Ectorhizobium quercum]